MYLAFSLFNNMYFISYDRIHICPWTAIPLGTMVGRHLKTKCSIDDDHSSFRAEKQTLESSNLTAQASHGAVMTLWTNLLHILICYYCSKKTSHHIHIIDWLFSFTFSWYSKQLTILSHLCNSHLVKCVCLFLFYSWQRDGGLCWSAIKWCSRCRGWSSDTPLYIWCDIVISVLFVLVQISSKRRPSICAAEILFRRWGQ